VQLEKIDNILGDEFKNIRADVKSGKLTQDAAGCSDRVVQGVACGDGEDGEGRHQICSFHRTKLRSARFRRQNPDARPHATSGA